MSKTWKRVDAKPYTPEQWAADPTRWEKWNRDRIEATFELLAAEGATLPLAEATVLKLGSELQALKEEHDNTLHLLKDAALQIKQLITELRESEANAQQANFDQARAQTALNAERVKSDGLQETVESLKVEAARLMLAQQELSRSLWDLREIASTIQQPSAAVKATIFEAGETFMRHRARR